MIDPFNVVGQVVCGWLCADALSGLTHWLEDRFFADSDTWFGREVIRPNREHHHDPLAMFQHGFWYRNYTTWLVVGVVALLWYAVAGLSVMLVVAAIGGASVYEVHRLTHAPRLAPRWVRVLQEVGIIQSAKQHARHHAPPQNRNYCVLTNFLNPVLDDLGVWRRLEAALIKIGVKPSLGES